MLKPGLVFSAQIGVLLERLRREQNQITEIDRVLFGKQILIDLVNVCDFEGFARGFAFIFSQGGGTRGFCGRAVCCGRDEFVLAPGDGAKNMHELIGRLVQILEVAQRQPGQVCFKKGQRPASSKMCTLSSGRRSWYLVISSSPN